MQTKRFSSFLRSVTKPVGITAVVPMLVVPMFLYAHPSSAQSDNDQARLLLQVQQMRQEIAELRDAVDQQAFQLRKVRAELEGVSQQRAANNAVPSQPAPFLQGQPQGQGQIAQPQIPQTGAVLVPGAVQGAQAETTADESEVSVNSNSQVNLNGTTPATQNTSDNSQRQYAPVVDRSIFTSDTYNGTSTAGAADQANPDLEDGYVSANDYNNSVDGAVVDGAVSAPTEGSLPIPAEGSLPAVTEGSLPAEGSLSAEGSLPAEGSRAAVQDQFPEGQRYPQTPPANSSNPTAVNSPAQVAQVPVTPVPASAGTATGTGVIAVPQGLPSANTQAVPSEPQVAVAPVQPAILPEQDYYQQGFELLKQSKHEQAVSVFTQQINAHPQGDFADDAYYWIAESMYVNRRLDLAKANFKTIVDNYKQSPRLPDAMLKIAYIEQDQGNKIEARLLLQDIMQYHPSSNAAISAKNRLAQLN